MHAACLAYKRPEWYAAAGFSSQIVGGEGGTPQWAAPESMDERGKERVTRGPNFWRLTMMMMCSCSIDNMTGIDGIHESLLEGRKGAGKHRESDATRENCRAKESRSSDSLMAGEH